MVLAKSAKTGEKTLLVVQFKKAFKNLSLLVFICELNEEEDFARAPS